MAVGGEELASEVMLGTTVYYKYDGYVTIKDVSGELDDNFEISEIQDCNINSIRIKCTMTRDPPLFTTQLVDMPITYYMQKSCIIYIKSKDDKTYEPIKVPIKYSFLKFKKFDESQNTINKKIERDIDINNLLNNNTLHVTLKIDNNSDINNLTTNLTITTTELITTKKLANSELINHNKTQSSILRNINTTKSIVIKEITSEREITSTEINTELTKNYIIYESTTNNNSNKLITLNLTIDDENENVKENKSGINYIEYIVLGVLMITVMILIMIIVNEYKHVTKSRNRYLMQMEDLEL